MSRRGRNRGKGKVKLATPPVVIPFVPIAGDPGSIERLDYWLRVPSDQVQGDSIDVPDRRGVLKFRDNGSNVLFVAHLDTVAPGKTLPAARWSGHRVQSAALDDRLGVWLLESLIASGTKADLLLTDCEETGRSTAAEFTAAANRYDLIVSADRRGTGCVLYQYEDSREWTAHCERWCGPVEHGSFSCISVLDHLEVCAVNCGVGYHAENGSSCWADLRVTRTQGKRIAELVEYGRSTHWDYFERFEVSSFPASARDGFGYGSSYSYPSRSYVSRVDDRTGRVILDPWDDYEAQAKLSPYGCFGTCPSCVDASSDACICELEAIEVGNEQWSYCTTHHVETERMR